MTVSPGSSAISEGMVISLPLKAALRTRYGRLKISVVMQFYGILIVRYLSVFDSSEKFCTERELEAPASFSLCLAILILRTAHLTQDDVASHLRCGKPTIVKVEGWFKELSFSQAEALCCDVDLIEESRSLIAKSEEELLIPTAIKVGAISSNRILRHYRSDYLEQKDKKIPAIEYEETPHKQKMRELAGELINEISLPWIMNSFIAELKPGQLVYVDPRGHRQGPPIVIAKDKKISVEISIEGKGEIDHLHKGLRSHLKTGNFSQVLDEIGNWRQGVTDNLAKCHGFFALIKKKLEKSYSVSIPLKYEEQPGFTMWFPITICSDAIEQASGSAHFRDFPYTHEGLNLKFGAYGIYGSIPNEDLKPYEDAHKRLRAKYGTHKQAKEIAKQREELYQIQTKIGQQLQKFMDMERLPGHCELCPSVVLGQ